MIPIDAEIMGESDIEIEGIGVDDVLTRMNDAGNAMNFIFLDACRDNPFEKSFKSATKGLKPMVAPAGVLIAFAAQANKVALQGPGKYSYFTEALAQEIVKPGISVLEMLRFVRVAVNKKTNGRQIPVTQDQLLAAYYFYPHPPDFKSQTTEEIERESTYIHDALVEKWSKLYQINPDDHIKFLKINNLEKKKRDFIFSENGEMINLTFISQKWDFEVNFRAPSSTYVVDLKNALIEHFQLRNHMTISQTYIVGFKLYHNYKSIEETNWESGKTKTGFRRLKDVGLKDGSVLQLQIMLTYKQFIQAPISEKPNA